VAAKVHIAENFTMAIMTLHRQPQKYPFPASPKGYQDKKRKSTKLFIGGAVRSFGPPLGRNPGPNLLDK
jgi:hypothetical protein